MKNGLNKFVKGLFAIFTIKLLLFGTMFIVQSCQTDDEVFENSEQRIALKKFENIAKSTTIKLKKITSKQNSFLYAKSKNSKEIEEAKEVLIPLIKGSKELFSAYGIDESDFLEELDSEDPRIAMLGLALLSTKTKNNEIALNLSNFFVTSAFAKEHEEPDAYDCALRAVGIDAVIELFNGKITKKIAKKAIRKIAGRTLGWVGAAWAAYEFGDCMEWY